MSSLPRLTVAQCDDLGKLDLPVTVTVAQAARLSGIGRETIRDLAEANDLPVIRTGKKKSRIRIPTEAFIRWIQDLEASHEHGAFMGFGNGK